ncbi:DUF4817 domain-containing protein [Trichonephila clavata]|uniref:DUF4817 domain-containing protein n=1 Tax=Trichonephila clavata TaxID=2740835 RepID=A0A8X6LJY4_TRICU|nr:DUF4817 domain-containing protein [Trichonephila clavata]
MNYLNTGLGKNDLDLIPWPPISPHLIPCSIFLGGTLRTLFTNPPLPQSFVELKERISAALQTIDRTRIQNVWNELDYRLNKCPIQGVQTW